MIERGFMYKDPSGVIHERVPGASYMYCGMIILQHSLVEVGNYLEPGTLMCDVCRRNHKAIYKNGEA